MVDDELWDKFLNARVVLWFCPDRDNADHPEKDSVHWETVSGKMVPECLVCGVKGAPR